MALHTIVEHDTTHIKPYIDNVKQALSNEVVTRSQLTAHNLFELKLNTQVINGITCTVNSDKSITINGTNSGTASWAWLGGTEKFKLNIPSGDYIVSGAPSGATTSNYCLKFYDEGDGTSTVASYMVQNGNEVSVHIDNTHYFSFYLWVGASKTASNVTFKPMIRMAEDSDTTYRPYVPTNSQLLSYKDNGVLGAKNQFKTDLALLKTLNTSGTWSGNAYTFKGITYTVNSDLSISASGTPESPNSYFLLSTNSGANKFSLLSGVWTLNGCPSGGSIDTYLLQASVRHTASTINDYRVFGGENTFSVNSSDSIVMSIIIKSGTVISGSLLFKPMIRLASDTDPTYQPYTMTNKELTDVAEQTVGGYILTKPTEYVAVTADGVKTVGKLLQELHTSLSQYYTNNPGKYLRPFSFVYSLSQFEIFKGASLRDSVLTDYIAKNIRIYDTYVLLDTFVFAAAQGNCSWAEYNTSTNTTTIKTDDVPSSGTQFVLYFDVYTKIS